MLSRSSLMVIASSIGLSYFKSRKGGSSSRRGWNPQSNIEKFESRLQTEGDSGKKTKKKTKPVAPYRPEEPFRGVKLPPQLKLQYEIEDLEEQLEEAPTSCAIDILYKYRVIPEYEGPTSKIIWSGGMGYMHYRNGKTKLKEDMNSNFTDSMWDEYNSLVLETTNALNSEIMRLKENKV